MEPRIQYAKTSDGVDIAFATAGDGPPLVFASNIWGDVHWYTHNEATRKEVDGLVASGWRIVRYDARGMGSSDREVSDFSLEARLRDLKAVVDQVGVGSFVLCGYGQGGPVAIAYATEYPDLISHLALVNSFASGSAYYERVPAMRTLKGIQGMAEEQWEFFTLTLASAVTGFVDTSVAQRTAAMFRSSMTPAAFLAFVEAAEKIDIVDILPDVAAPTLVVADRSAFMTGDLSRVLASSIPGASYIATDDYTRELALFVRGEAPSPSMPDAPVPLPPLPSGTAVILFADIVDSTALTERLGDAAFREKARDLDGVLRAVIRENGGTPIDGKLLGDGVLAVFTSARQAIEAAQRCAAAGNHGELPLHLGLHAGDVIREEGNVYGGAVNIAARISGLSAPGEVLVSDTVRSLARTSAGVAFEDRGEQSLKGVGERVRVWAVRSFDSPSAGAAGGSG